jgi:hypothetical protein
MSNAEELSRPKFGAALIECAKKKCDWIGTERDLKRVQHPKFSTVQKNVCPKCGSEGYYFLKSK